MRNLFPGLFCKRNRALFLHSPAKAGTARIMQATGIACRTLEIELLADTKKMGFIPTQSTAWLPSSHGETEPSLGRRNADSKMIDERKRCRTSAPA
jgi:hypothetical protein